MALGLLAHPPVAMVLGLLAAAQLAQAHPLVAMALGLLAAAHPPVAMALGLLAAGQLAHPPVAMVPMALGLLAAAQLVQAPAGQVAELEAAWRSPHRRSPRRHCPRRSLPQCLSCQCHLVRHVACEVARPHQLVGDAWALEGQRTSAPASSAPAPCQAAWLRDSTGAPRWTCRARTRPTPTATSPQRQM